MATTKNYQQMLLTIAVFVINNWERMAWVFLRSIFLLSLQSVIASLLGNLTITGFPFNQGLEGSGCYFCNLFI